MLYKISVGSNNETKRLEDRKAIKITARYFEGFGTYKGLSYWKRKPERSLFIEIETPYQKRVIKLSKVLCKELKQDAVMVAKIGKAEFITA